MDLKIKEVAELLNVSETTIRRWLADGKIPAYKINHQYRFNRAEIEHWVLGQKLGVNMGSSPFEGVQVKEKKRQQKAEAFNSVFIAPYIKAASCRTFPE